MCFSPLPPPSRLPFVFDRSQTVNSTGNKATNSTDSRHGNTALRDTSVSSSLSSFLMKTFDSIT